MSVNVFVHYSKAESTLGVGSVARKTSQCHVQVARENQGSAFPTFPTAKKLSQEGSFGKKTPGTAHEWSLLQLDF